MTDIERQLHDLEDAVSSFSKDTGNVMGRLCSVLIARGVLAEFDTDYIGGKITSDEWKEKYKESMSLTNIFQAMFGGLEPDKNTSEEAKSDENDNL